MTKNRQPLKKRIEDVIQKSKEEARSKNARAPRAEEPTPPKQEKKIDDFRDMMVRNRSEVFYNQKLEWDRKIKEELFEKRVQEWEKNKEVRFNQYQDNLKKLSEAKEKANNTYKPQINISGKHEGQSRLKEELEKELVPKSFFDKSDNKTYQCLLTSRA